VSVSGRRWSHSITGAAKSKLRGTAQEIQVAVKSRAGRYAEVAIRSRHPYELPEIIAVSLTDGLAPYLQWLADETVAS